MKKRLLTVAIIAVLIISIFVCVGCTSGNTFNKYNGTYTYTIPVLNIEAGSIVIKGGTATFEGTVDFVEDEDATVDIVIDGDEIAFVIDGEEFTGKIDKESITIMGAKFVKE